MRNLLVIFAVVALTAVVTYVMDYGMKPRMGAGKNDMRQEIPMNAPAPDFSFTTLQGETKKLSDLQGKITIVHVWATWCPPCIIEYPSILRFVDAMNGKVVLLSLSVDKDTKKIGTFYKQLDTPLQQTLEKDFVKTVWDKRRDISLGKFGTQLYPETIVIDATGNIVKKYIGDYRSWELPETKKEFENLLQR